MQYLNDYLFSDDFNHDQVVPPAYNESAATPAEGQCAGREFSLTDQAGLLVASTLFSLKRVSSASLEQDSSILMESSWKHLKIAASDVLRNYMPFCGDDSFIAGSRELQSHNIPKYWEMINGQHMRVAQEQLAALKLTNPTVFAEIESLPQASLDGCCFGMMLNLFVHFLSLPPEQRTPENFSQCFNAYESGATPEAVASQLIFTSLPTVLSLDSADSKSSTVSKRGQMELEAFLITLGKEVPSERIQSYLEDTRCYHGNRDQRIVRALQVCAFLDHADKTNNQALSKYAPLIKRMLAEEGPRAYRLLADDLNSIIDEDSYFKSKLFEVYSDTVAHFDNKRSLVP